MRARIRSRSQPRQRGGDRRRRSQSRHARPRSPDLGERAAGMLPDRRRHHRRAAGERLQHHVGAPLVGAGQHEEVGGAVPGGQLLAPRAGRRRPPGRRSPSRAAEAPQLVLLRPLGAVAADDGVAQVRQALSASAASASDHQVEPLARRRACPRRRGAARTRAAPGRGAPRRGRRGRKSSGSIAVADHPHPLRRDAERRQRRAQRLGDGDHPAARRRAKRSCGRRSRKGASSGSRPRRVIITGTRKTRPSERRRQPFGIDEVGVDRRRSGSSRRSRIRAGSAPEEQEDPVQALEDAGKERNRGWSTRTPSWISSRGTAGRKPGAQAGDAAGTRGPARPRATSTSGRVGRASARARRRRGAAGRRWGRRCEKTRTRARGRSSQTPTARGTSSRSARPRDPRAPPRAPRPPA